MCPRATERARLRRRFRRAHIAALLTALVLLTGAGARGAPPLADLPLAPGAAADRIVERYLQERGLASLLTAQLWERLAGAEDASRTRIAEKLARVYAIALDSPLDAAERSRVERESQRLLSRLPTADAADLRITLLRSTYAQAERSAERWLLRLASAAERDEASQNLRRLGREFEAIADDANVRVHALEDQEDAMEGALARQMAQRLAQERGRRSQARYLAAWAHAYDALLTGSRESAARGMESASWVLGAGATTDVNPGDLSDRLLRFEHVARAAIAEALCEAVLDDSALATDWFDAVEGSPSVSAAVREELPARRALALAILQRWSALTSLVDASPTLSTAALRLIAAQSLAAVADGVNAARRPAELAVARLIRDGRVSHVLDLATQFGVDSLPEGGFVALYVRGVSASREAARLEASDPQRARALRREAAARIGAALDAPDARRYTAIEHAAAMTAGAALVRAADSAADRAKAADWFERAARAATNHDDEGEALWGAIAALSSDGEADRRRALLDRFVAEFAGHPRFAAAAIERARLPGVDVIEAANDLLRVAAGDPLARPARVTAANLLFEAMRTAGGAERAGLAEQYLSAATPLLMEDAVAAESGDSAAADRALARARRALEAAFVVDPPRVESAQRALQVVDLLGARRAAGLDAARDELDERRIRLLVQRGEFDAAQTLLDAMRSRVKNRPSTGGKAWTRSAALALAQASVSAWRVARGGDDPEAMRRAAQRMLDAAGNSDLLEENGAANVAASLAPDIAEAAFFLWSGGGAESALSAAWRANEAALAAAPRDRAALRRKGALAQAKGDANAALDAWRTLAAGLAPESRDWFEARAGVIEALAEISPARARAALKQHAAMHPDLGPEPWRSKLRALAERLGVPTADVAGGGA